MSTTFPFITDNSALYPAECGTTRCSLAVWLEDEYTGSKSLGNVNVKIWIKNKKIWIKNKKIKPIKSPSGYYIFTDLEEGKYRLEVESEFFLPKMMKKNEKIEIPMSNPLEPVLELTLTPGPTYPFPGYATLVRGLVLQTEQDPDTGQQIRVPVADATIKVKKRNEISKTNDRGEFVLYFKGVEEEEITIKAIYKREDQSLNKSENVTIKEGTTQSTVIVFE